MCLRMCVCVYVCEPQIKLAVCSQPVLQSEAETRLWLLNFPITLCRWSLWSWFQVWNGCFCLLLYDTDCSRLYTLLEEVLQQFYRMEKKTCFMCCFILISNVHVNTVTWINLTVQTHKKTMRLKVKVLVRVYICERHDNVREMTWWALQELCHIHS